MEVESPVQTQQLEGTIQNEAADVVEVQSVSEPPRSPPLRTWRTTWF